MTKGPNTHRVSRIEPMPVDDGNIDPSTGKPFQGWRQITETCPDKATALLRKAAHPGSTYLPPGEPNIPLIPPRRRYPLERKRPAPGLSRNPRQSGV
jgi:hypothetical protein